MPFSSLLPKRLLTLFLLSCSLTLTACGTLPSSNAFYHFGFHAAADTPGIIVLDYRYTQGDTVILGLSSTQTNAPSFKGVWQGAIGGRLPVGDKLYVKWKELSSGSVREVTADLKDRFPSDMNDKSVRFVIGVETVHVYVASLKGFLTTECPSRYKERAGDPRNPDLIARSYFCGTHLQKIYPEAKQLS